MLSAESLQVAILFSHGYGERKKRKACRAINGPISREIEFRGLVKMKGQYQFSLFNSDQKSYWLKNEAAAQGISVRNYDSGSNHSLASGRTERITLITANSSPLPVVASVSPPINTIGNTNKPELPPPLQNVTKPNTNNDVKRAVPRRRVILPKK